MDMLSESGGCVGAAWAITVAACESPVGGGSAPGHSLASFGIRIAGERIDELAGALRIGQPAVLGRLAGDALWLDLRTVDDDELASLATRLSEAFAACG